MSRYFLGVDGGQSSTLAFIADETGRFAGGGTGGPCNHVGAEGGRKKFVAAIGGCLRAACEVAGLDPKTITFEAACLGFSGGPEDKKEILEEMLRVNRLIVTDDALIALAGATGGGPGIMTIAGTGSISFGRNSAGKSVRAGGWGYVYGDEGGAFDITRQALRAMLRQEEGWGPPTALHEAFLAITRAKSANALLHRFYTRGYPRKRVAEFAVLVNRVAMEGDAIAREILHNAAQQLATLVGAVRAQLFQPGEPAIVSYIGGVFESVILLERYRMLVEFEEGNRFMQPIYGPATGALLEAYRTAGLSPELSHFPIG
jgi:N-acetylglucosamine kinase-like BadF-type ATPase